MSGAFLEANRESQERQRQRDDIANALTSSAHFVRTNEAPKGACVYLPRPKRIKMRHVPGEWWSGLVYDDGVSAFWYVGDTELQVISGDGCSGVPWSGVERIEF